MIKAYLKALRGWVGAYKRMGKCIQKDGKVHTKDLKKDEGRDVFV